ncbi:hypothetical protein J8273_2257 [Carpediemonas membranifera]|uniref:Uncharacterized protein n=1 Tax=Carpediemonas membranifera TaxID=201153 RepID=A0A8J6AVL9_9EUKA|nr:hypothetical protein J8273_2257 [Carpediemonas membranifera]|eukprot:KAG9395911.1 hypothetical protein J8273_2257 [Carpediemonas membranifera]
MKKAFKDLVTLSGWPNELREQLKKVSEECSWTGKKCSVCYSREHNARKCSFANGKNARYLPSSKTLNTAKLEISELSYHANYDVAKLDLILRDVQDELSAAQARLPSTPAPMSQEIVDTPSPIEMPDYTQLFASIISASGERARELEHWELMAWASMVADDRATVEEMPMEIFRRQRQENDPEIVNVSVMVKKTRMTAFFEMVTRFNNESLDQ